MVFGDCSDSFGESYKKVTSIPKDSQVTLVQSDSFRISTMTQAIDSMFISHGAPTFAIDPGQPGKALEHIGQQLLAQNTQALIVLSPHWRSNKLAVTSHEAPVIVHDFHGFPKELYELQPEICGAPQLATELAAESVELRPQQGFDHGAWVPYIHLFPQGGPPMLQLSMPINWTAQTAMHVGAVVGEFARKHHAVVVGSGSLTHNFDDMDLRSGAASEAVPEYVGEFTHWIQSRLQAGDRHAIAQAATTAPGFERAHPDDDHFLPLPFAMGAARPESRVEVLPEDIRYKALSMQSFVFLHHHD